MGEAPLLHQALTASGLPCRLNEPLQRRGWWRVGGPADVWCDVGDQSSLSRCMTIASAAATPVTVIGNGSNLLVADAGIRGVAIKLTNAFRESSVETRDSKPMLVAGAGVPNTVLLKRIDSAGLHGLGCLAGVPGTLGGAIRMNAGTHIGEIGDRVEAVEIVHRDGRLERLSGTRLNFRYRRADLPPGAIITRAWIRLESEGLAQARAAVRSHLERRKATQPLDKPSCGSTFRNPEGDAAGRLIEAAGLKGHRIGGAMISPKHANFFLNTGTASASELRSLIVHARSVVFDRFGVALEPEVHAVGDWPAGSWPLPPLE